MKALRRRSRISGSTRKRRDIDRRVSRNALGAPISLLCGAALAACSVVAFVVPLADPAWARSMAAAMIFAGGVAEIIVGFFGVHDERGPTDVGLGLLSLAVASILALAGEIGALALTGLLSVWLLARGATELIGGFAASSEFAGVAVARLVRGAADLILGLAASIGSLATVFPIFLVSWPSAIVRTILLFVAISLMTSAILHGWLALAIGRPRRR
jgi:uncharacterized membrane protein HdeD (DUF308 family)